MGANAQTSVPAFTAGQVLTAAQVTGINTGIPVFASSTERDAAFGGTGEKTLAEGQMAYLEDTNETQYYDGSSWTTIGASGLVFISRTTIGSAVSSVTLSNIFSADYDNYRILISGGSGSSNQFINFSFPGAATAAYNSQAVYGSWNNTAQAAGSSGANAYFRYMGTMTPTSLQGCVDIQSPYLTEQTFLGSFYARPSHIGGVTANVLDDSSSYTGLTVAPASGTFSDGNIDVYGYAKA